MVADMHVQPRMPGAVLGLGASARAAAGPLKGFAPAFSIYTRTTYSQLCFLDWIAASAELGVLSRRDVCECWVILSACELDFALLLGSQPRDLMCCWCKTRARTQLCHEMLGVPLLGQPFRRC